LLAAHVGAFIGVRWERPEIMASKTAAHPALAQKVAGKVSALRRRYPKLQRGEALTAYAHLLVQRDVLEQAMLDGAMDARQWRALSEVSRMVVDLGRSLGVIASPPRAGGSADADPDEYLDDEEYVRRILTPPNKEKP
jgi:hypothetical protein